MALQLFADNSDLFSLPLLLAQQMRGYDRPSAGVGEAVRSTRVDVVEVSRGTFGRI